MCTKHLCSVLRIVLCAVCPVILLLTDLVWFILYSQIVAKSNTFQIKNKNKSNSATATTYEVWMLQIIY